MTRWFSSCSRPRIRPTTTTRSSILSQRWPRTSRCGSDCRCRQAVASSTTPFHAPRVDEKAPEDVLDMSGGRAEQHDPIVLAPAWGSLWGIALGTWILIPDIVVAHHIRIENGVQWATLLLALSVVF